MSGDIEVGTCANSRSGLHGFLWTGTAASAVDLTPDGLTGSYASAVSNGVEVGLGSNGHALKWTGTAASAVDLQPFLSGLTFNGAPLTLTRSWAKGSTVLETLSARHRAHRPHLWGVWQVVPEPASLTALGLGAVTLLRKRRINA